MSILNNPILSTDGYKFSHAMQYPAGTTEVLSHVAARGTTVEGCDEVVFNGPQAYIKQRLLKPVTREHVEEAAKFCAAYGTPFNYDGWMHIVTEHKGFLPIEIRSVPEGTVVPVGNVLATIRNLDEKCAWLPSYIETDYLRWSWFPTTVASLGRHMKKKIKHYLDLTSDNADAVVSWKLHDFAFRGVSSFESAAIGGCAHLINFLGTDTVAGIGHAMEYYDADIVGFSIPASEHSTSTLKGREGELDVYRNMVAKYAVPGAIFANVIDSYDTYAAVRMYHEDGLFNKVADAGATVVMRPDSGDPIQTPINVIQLIMELEGFKTNSKGFKVLPDHIRVIQGDGIDHDDVVQILQKMFDLKLSAENIGFGMGGGLLQKVNRDHFKFAQKACHATIEGQEYDVYKQPAEAPDKKSLKGRIDLYRNTKTGELKTFNFEDLVQSGYDGSLFCHEEESYRLATVVMFRSYRGNIVTNFTTFEEVRNRAKI